MTAMDKLRRATRKTLSFKKSSKHDRNSPEQFKSSDSGHGSVQNEFSERSRPKEQNSKRDKRSKHKSKDKSKDARNNNLPSVLLPRAFYDTEKKLIALEQAYVTLKKVLTKHFSNDKSTIRRSFHEAKSKLERNFSQRSLDAVSLDRYGSNRSLDSIGSNHSNKAMDSYKVCQRLLKEAEKLEHEGLSSLVFKEMAKSLNFCKSTEQKN